MLPPAALQNQSYEVQDVQEVQVVEEVPEAQPEQEAPPPQEEHVENGAPPQNTEVADHDHLNSDEGKLFLGGLSWDTTEEKLKEHFSKFGQIHDVVVMREPMTNRSRGFGFVHFLSAAVAGQALLEDHVIDGKTIDAKKAVPKGTHAEKFEKSTKIFVGGISHMVTEDDLMNCFSKFGNVLSANLMIDKESGKPRGFGFVNFEDSSAVMAVLAAGPITLGDKTVDIKNAQPRFRNNTMGRGGHSSYSRHPGPSSMRGGRTYGGPPYGGRHPGYGAPPQQPAPYRGYNNGGSRYGMVTAAPRADGYGATSYGYGAYGYPYGQPAAQPTSSYGRYPSQSQRPMYGGYEAAAPSAYDPYARAYQQPAAVPTHPREADPYAAQAAAQAYGAAARGRYPSRPQPRQSFGYHPYTR
ncbi:hypothetical protein DSO57_1021372 [Entomophthora muscae]|uniref:Uncharacterized protein n=1 Tax=Entomophthora muscae TaxID=34485 RepID=A0ACC2UPV0_9FUNG|nr:hypothetical protein DSO57_1021372 [Entomophthora muscae]